MWCTNCRQDVPGVASQPDEGWPSPGPLACIRCGLVLLKLQESDSTTSAQDPAAAFDEEQPDSASLDLPAAFDSWELEERLRHVKRLLAPPAERESRPATFSPDFRVDAGHAIDRQFADPADSSLSPPQDQAAGGGWSALAAWSAISLGLAAFTCGGILCGWSLAAQREELRTIGLPVLLAGQMILVFGLLLQLRRVWGGRGRRSHADDRTGSRRRKDAAGTGRTR
jgi:hypothetical protein